MKSLIHICGCIAVFSATGIIPSSFANEQKPVKLTGEFVWAADKTHTKTPVTALLQPQGEKEYTAIYTFTWHGKLHNYHGKVTGDLQSGNVEGTGDADDAKRFFTFKGTAANGEIKGNCFELKGSNVMPQGNVEFKVQSAQ